MGDVVIATPMKIEARAIRSSSTVASTVVTGIGARRAAQAGRRLATTVASPFAVAGFAGGLRPEHRPGQVVVATEVRQVDDAAVFTLPGAAALADQLRRVGFDVISGPVISSPTLAWGRARGRLAESGAVAVDMESAWLAAPLHDLAAHRTAVVRVLSDTRGLGLHPYRFVSEGARAYRTLSRLTPAIEQWGRAVAPRVVLLAQPRSFCAGVDRAITTVRRALELHGAPVYVRRQIIHNIHVVRELEAAGAIFVQELSEVPRGATAIIAAHGVAPEVRDEGTRLGLRLIDATCPLVAKVHTEARVKARSGFEIVLIGHADHEEIVGTRAEAPAHIQVISRVAEIDDLDIPAGTPVAYLTQTTLAIDETAEVVAALHERFPRIVGPRADDICYATQNRQEAVRVIAAESDLVLVVGSQNSSNSNRLVEVARRQGCAAELIEDETEIDLSWLCDVRVVGVTAGASAPESLVQRVTQRLAGLGEIDVVEHVTTSEDVRFALPAEVR